MIGRILKLDQEPEPAEPPKRGGVRRWLVLGAAVAAIFAGVALMMLRALPRPHSRGDYMIAGELATMVSMLALFGVLLSTHVRARNLFFKRRPK